jgi:hypothetical protein
MSNYARLSDRFDKIQHLKKFFRRLGLFLIFHLNEDLFQGAPLCPLIIPYFNLITLKVTSPMGGYFQTKFSEFI